MSCLRFYERLITSKIENHYPRRTNALGDIFSQIKKASDWMPFWLKVRRVLGANFLEVVFWKSYLQILPQKLNSAQPYFPLF